MFAWIRTSITNIKPWMSHRFMLSGNRLFGLCFGFGVFMVKFRVQRLVQVWKWILNRNCGFILIYWFRINRLWVVGCLRKFICRPDWCYKKFYWGWWWFAPLLRFQQFIFFFWCLNFSCWLIAKTHFSTPIYFEKIVEIKINQMFYLRDANLYSLTREKISKISLSKCHVNSLWMASKWIH